MSNEEIVARIQAGDRNEKELLTELYNNNVGFIKQISAEYRSRVNPTEYDDLEQEGFIGLYEAIQRFDSSQGFAFISFAKYYIKKCMIQYVRHKSKVLRLPNEQINLITRFRKYSVRVLDEKGRIPTDKEYREYLGIGQKRLNALRDLSNQIKLRSLNEPIDGGGESFEIIDTIPDKATFESDIVGEEYDREVKDVLWTEVDNLNEKDSFVLRERYINNKTLLEIGRELGVTQERARQRESKALSKLKRNLRILNLVKDSDIVASSTKRVGLSYYQNNGSSSVEWAVMKICEQDDKRNELESQIDNVIDIRKEILREYLIKQG